MSNYPPGVTGREFAIAGPDWEGEEQRTCENTDVEVVIQGVDGPVAITLPECPVIDFEVGAWAFGGVLHWTCPVCGREYEEDGRDG